MHGFLSPDHANLPLPVSAPPGAANGRSSPAPSAAATRQGNLPEQIYNVHPDGQLSSGFLASPTVTGPPVIPHSTGGSAPPQRYSVPYGPPSSDRESARSRSPVSFYAASPVPAGVTYPAPPISRSATYNAYTQSAGSNPSVTSDGRRRRGSLGATAGMTPVSRTKPIQTVGSATDSVGGSTRDSRASWRQSNVSLASDRSRPHNSRRDPGVYNDLPFLASRESIVDSVTGANTVANGGVRHVRVHESPRYGYASLRTNE